jgi:hypothetical protein
MKKNSRVTPTVRLSFVPGAADPPVSVISAIVEC